MAKMNPKVKKLWVEELRSGRIKQGQRQLRNLDNEMCCLGVLCNLHAQAHPKIAAEQPSPTAYMGKVSYPPAEVLKWAGLTYFDPFVTASNGLYVSLSELNDGVNGVRRHSFKSIAKIIEEQL